MKIVLITDTLHPGGSERVMSILANEFVKKSIDVEIICLRGDKSFYFLDENVRVTYAVNCAETGKSLFHKLIWLRRHIITSSPDVVISFMTSVYCFTLLALAGTRCKVITSERIDPRYSKWYKKLMRSVLLPLTKCHVVQTTKIKQYFPKSIAKKCVVIYNPINDNVFTLPPQVTPNKRFVNVGRLAAQKNQKMLIDAFKIVWDDNRDFQLDIYGEGPLRDELQQYIDDIGMSDSIFLRGTTNDILSELNKSYAFCLSSRYEGMSNALMEALCVGLPIVTTNVSGITEIVEDGINGYIVECDSAVEYAKAMMKVISDADTSLSMQHENRQKGKRLFDKEVILTQWLHVIDIVVNDK